MIKKPYRRFSHKQEPLPIEPGKPLRIDYLYRREDTCNLFQVFDPHRAWRHIEVTEHGLR